MSFADQCEMARAVRRRAAALGFDDFTVTATEKRLVGVRVAQGVVCRENVDRYAASFLLRGSWQGREAQREGQADGVEALHAQLAELRRDLELQPRDKEAVAAPAATGALSWDLPARPFEEAYGPEALYPAIERHLKRARAAGLRVTGYLEAQELRAHVAAAGHAGELDLTTRDFGATLNLTVDDHRSGAAVGGAAGGAVGATQRAALSVAGGGEIEPLFGEALDEAMAGCLAGANPRELPPGDYPVVFHPAAVQDLVQTALLYGLFDRRKIDEKRTYLSGKFGELAFPDGLRLAQPLALPLPGGGVYADLPLNHRNVPCQGLELIADGRIKDLQLTPYWAERLGLTETFAMHAAPPTLLMARPGSPLAGKHKDLAALIAATERGVFIANVWYLRMVAEMDGMITGMTRDGCFWIEDGKIAYPLLNMRWHDNPLRVLGAVTGMSEERRLCGRPRLTGTGRTPLSAMPALRVDDFHFSSVTKF